MTSLYCKKALLGSVMLRRRLRYRVSSWYEFLYLYKYNQRYYDAKNGACIRETLPDSSF